MRRQDHTSTHTCHRQRRTRFWSPPQFLRRWYPIYVVIAGLFAVAWLLLRTGTKPSRLAYPCQQAAFSAAALAFGTSLVGAVVALRRRLSVRWLTPVGIALGSIGAVVTFGTWSYVNSIDAYTGPLLDPPRDYVAQVFSQTDCPQDPVGDRFICVEDLLEMLGSQGIKLHRSPTVSLTAGPEGIIAPADVVLLKINYQWSDRGGTNTDLLRGLIRRIVDHPDTFTGEIVIVENTQFASANNFDRAANNAQDHSLSPLDVVQHFKSLGHRISHYIWTGIRYTTVQEYSAGDQNDGYVVYPYDSQIGGRISYPKFQTEYGTRISLRHGIYTPPFGYSRVNLKFINLPILKSHHATYGATAMVKHYMGVATRELSTNSHGAIGNGLMGALMGQIQPADLNILDAIWINANPNSGPATSYAGATRTDRLVASLDPIAGDLWAVKNILIPAFQANGYSPPWPYPSADPDNPSSAFRIYLDRSMNYLLAAGYEVTNNLSDINPVQLGPPGEASDPTGPGTPFTLAKTVDGYELAWSGPFRGGRAEEYELYGSSLAGLPVALQPECEANLGMGHSAVLSTLPDDYGFFVVARNSVGDGSMGRNSLGHDRSSPLESEVCP
jgi:hypothetical protein